MQKKFFKSLESQKIQKDKAAVNRQLRQQRRQQQQQQHLQSVVKELAELDSITFNLASQVATRRKD